MRLVRLARWATVIQLLCGSTSSWYVDSSYVSNRVLQQTGSKRCWRLFCPKLMSTTRACNYLTALGILATASTIKTQVCIAVTSFCLPRQRRMHSLALPVVSGLACPLAATALRCHWCCWRVQLLHSKYRLASQLTQLQRRTGQTVATCQTANDGCHS